MEVVCPRCAGLDVHRDTVVACARTVEATGVTVQVETFGTTTAALGELAGWLNQHGVTHAAMEATGVYWKPVWTVLDGEFDLVLANASHVRNVPGRKTDVSDAQWIADLLAHVVAQMGRIRLSECLPQYVPRSPDVLARVA